MIQDFTIPERKIQAIQYSGNIEEAVEFTGGEVLNTGKRDWLSLIVNSETLVIHTGNWIVKFNDYYFEVYTDVKFLRLIGQQNNLCAEREMGFEVCSEQCDDCKNNGERLK